MAAIGTGGVDLNNQAVNKDSSPTFVNVTLTAPVGIESLLVSKSVNVGAAADTVLYTVPAGYTCIITKINIRNASASFNQATDPVITVGWDADADVVASATLVTPTATTMVVPLTVLATQTKGAAGEDLELHVTTAATASTTAIMDVFGYLLPA